MRRLPRLWLFLAALAAAPAAASGQGLVVRDGTVGDGPAGEVVGPGSDPLGSPATYLITPEMGEQRGSNLFHSFESFGIGPDETATFTGPDPIDGPQSVSNVISRVTGGDESQIDGTLRSTIPGADLWLLNPSGVVFGDGARLDVPGSFHASTGDYVGFGEGDLVRFYADPARPSVLSTARPEAFGFLGEGPAAAISVSGATLAVSEGETLELVGGNVTLTSAELSAPAGAVSIRGERIVVEEGSSVLAENAGEEAAGAITVEASESVMVDGSLLSVNTSSAGDAGTIRIIAPDVTFQNGPGLLFDNPHATKVGASAETGSRGAGGTIEIDAGTLVVSEGASVSARTFGLGATGHAGMVRISADSVDVSAQSDISAGAWRSQGDGGAVEIETHRLRVDGSDGYAAVWTTSAESFQFLPPGSSVPGSPGRIDITARSIELLNGGTVQSNCYDCTPTADVRPEGAATVRIHTDLLVIEGSNESNSSFVSANVFADPGEVVTGDAGTIQIEADSIQISSAGPWNPGIYANSNYFAGSAGTIRIETGSLSVGDGGLISTAADSGRAGTIDIVARTLALEAGGMISANTFGSGDAGTITVRADSVRIGPGEPAFISASSFGPGRAGTVDIEATDSILVTAEGAERHTLLERLQLGLHTGIFSATVLGGDSGSVNLSAPEITVTDGGTVATSTVGGGNAGTVLLRGERILVANGGSVDSTSLPHPGSGRRSGDAGAVTLEATESITVAGSESEFGRVSSYSLGSGAAGAVTLRAPRIVIDSGVVATTALPPGSGIAQEGSRGGAIALDAQEEILVTNGGQVDASTFIAGAGGSIDVTAGESIVIEGEGSGIASRTGGAGLGGSVSLGAPRIEVSQGGKVSAESAPGLGALTVFLAGAIEEFLIGPVPDDPAEVTGDAGSIMLVADRLHLNGGTLATNAEAADGGDVSIQAKDLVHLDGGVITAAVRDGSGGNITIDPEVVILQHGSRIVADAGAGSGGNIQINADNYFAFADTVVDASSELGIDGIVEVHTPDVDLAGKITTLPTTLLDAASLMRERCAARRSGERAGSFAVHGNGGIPAEPDGWLPAAAGFELERGLVPATERPSRPANAPRLARLGACE